MGRQKVPRRPSRQIKNIEVIFVELPKEENDERIQKLTSQILGILEDSYQRRKTSREREERFLESDFEKEIGL